VPLFERAFVYTAEGRMVQLPNLDEGDEAQSGALAISADGRVIGGFSTTSRGREATVWIDRTPVLLEDLLSESGQEVPAGWVLQEVRAITSDARVFVGNALNAAGRPEGFRVALAFPD
jgi:probable HAF family extracellular repeat protein